MGSNCKKGVYALLASSLLFSSLPVYADSLQEPAEKVMIKISDLKEMENAKITKDQAISAAKKAMPIPDGYVQRNVEFQSMWWGSNTPAWVLYWDHPGKENGNIQVAVDANSGTIMNIEFYTYNAAEATSYPPKVNSERAQELALEYIKKQFPENFGHVQLDDQLNMQPPPLTGIVQYPFVFKRTVNGIIFDNNEIRVTVDGNGQIVGFSYRWSDDIEFPAASSTITTKQAEEKFAEHLDLTLRLLHYYGPKTGNQQDFLAYMPTWLGGMGPYPPIYIRASDGVFVTPWGDEIDPKQIQTMPVATEKLGELANGTDLKQEEALKILRKDFPIPEKADMIRANYREQNADTPVSVWEFNWEIPRDDLSKRWSSASIDAKTGRVLNYYNGDHVIYEKRSTNDSTETYEAKFSQADGEKIAIELVKKLNPDLAEHIFLLRSPVNPYEVANSRIYNYQFVLEKNSVTLENNGISVSFDSATGELTNYLFNPENLLLPDQAQEVVSKKAAQEAYLAMTNMRLTYVLPQEIPNVHPAKSNSVTKAMLIYQPLLKQFGEPLYLDAKTGAWVNRETGKPYIAETNITDMAGNPYEKELRILMRYNVFDASEGKIYPNGHISRGEMIKMLMLVQNNGYHGWVDPNRKETFNDVGKGSPYFTYVENAIDQKLLDHNISELKPDEKINREELAELIIHALGYRSLLDVPGLFTIDLKDTTELKNPAAAELITKLGILDTVEGNFQGQQPVTRGEAAAAFYRYLMKRSNTIFPMR